VGEPPLIDALEQVGLTITGDSPDYVVVGFDRGFDYAKLTKACELIYAGSKFIATNPDKGLRVENAIYPGTGAIVAAVEAGCGVSPVIVGKPEKLIFEMALTRMGLKSDEVIAIGDNVDTDIPAAKNADIRSALILTGISSREDAEKADIQPDWIVDSYEELKRIVEPETG